MSRELIQRMLNLMRVDRNFLPNRHRRMLMVSVQALAEIERDHPNDPAGDRAADALDRIQRLQQFR